MAEPSGTISVVVNGESKVVSENVVTVGDVLEDLGFGPDRYDLYRDMDTRTLGESERCGGPEDPIVVDGGDEFVIIPEYVNNG